MTSQAWTYSTRNLLSHGSKMKTGEELFDKIVAKESAFEDSFNASIQTQPQIQAMPKRKQGTKNKRSKQISIVAEMENSIQDTSFRIFQSDKPVKEKKKSLCVPAKCSSKNRQDGDLQLKRKLREVQTEEDRGSSVSPMASVNDSLFIEEEAALCHVPTPQVLSASWDENAVARTAQTRCRSGRGQGERRSKTARDDSCLSSRKEGDIEDDNSSIEIAREYSEAAFQRRGSMHTRSPLMPLALSDGDSPDNNTQSWKMENRRLKKRCSLAKDDGHLSSKEVDDIEDDNSSIEMARKIPEPVFKQFCGGLNRSPLMPFVMSDGESSCNTPRANQKTDSGWIMTSSGGLGDSCTSSSQNDDSISDSGTCSSKYTYTQVSTYTAATSTGISSSKAASNSPPVKMKKTPYKLNSTTYKDKDNIGSVVFPDSISPVQESTPARKSASGQPASRKHKDKTASISRQGRGPPKCSTMLFTSDCSHAPFLGSRTLTTIHSMETRGMAAQNQTRTPHSIHGKKEDILLSGKPQSSPCMLPKCPHDDDKQNKQHMKASTPYDTFITTSFNVSPIALPSLDDEEGLQVNFSTEVNSDEIIVPSLMEPTILPGDSGQTVRNEDASSQSQEEKSRTVNSTRKSATGSQMQTYSHKEDIGDGARPSNGQKACSAFRPKNVIYDVNGNMQDLTGIKSIDRRCGGTSLYADKRSTILMNCDGNGNIAECGELGHNNDVVHNCNEDDAVVELDNYDKTSFTDGEKSFVKKRPVRERVSKAGASESMQKRMETQRFQWSDSSMDEGNEVEEQYNNIQLHDQTAVNDQQIEKGSKKDEFFKNSKTRNRKSEKRVPVCFINRLCMASQRKLKEKLMARTGSQV